jgi:FkbM family methyltransferase
MKTVVKKLIRSFGYEIIKSYRAPTRRTMEESLRHLSRLGYCPSVIIDVGTASGTDDLVNVYPDSRYLWIEPLQEFETDLKRLQSKYSGDYLIGACGRTEGRVTMNVHPSLTGSSILHEADGEEADGVPREVPMLRLDDLAEKYGIKANVLLKVDVQGAELEVLEGAQDLLPACEIIILEVSFFKFLKTNPEFCDVINYMKEKGFVAYDIFGGTNRLLDGAVAMKDVLFVKEEGRFRMSHGWATIEQRRRYVAGYRRHNP